MREEEITGGERRRCKRCNKKRIRNKREEDTVGLAWEAGFGGSRRWNNAAIKGLAFLVFLARVLWSFLASLTWEKRTISSGVRSTTGKSWRVINWLSLSRRCRSIRYAAGTCSPESSASAWRSSRLQSKRKKPKENVRDDVRQREGRW